MRQPPPTPQRPPPRDPGPPRGLLRHPPGPGRFHHARLPPGPDLADTVQHFWIVRWDLRGHPPQVRRTLPHPNAHLVLQSGGRSQVHGVHTGRFERRLEGCDGVFGVKFRPGGFSAFLGRPLSRLRDRSLPARDIFGTAVDALAEALAALDGDEAAMVAATEGFLRARDPAPDVDARLAGQIVDDIAADPATTRVEQLQARWRIPARRLQRLFGTHVGVPPKWVIQRFRLHEALERVSAGGGIDWADLAQALGYFDQAHFIRDFRRLVGQTPAQYMRSAAHAD